MANYLHSSPHERMLAYLRGGDDLIPPGLEAATDWDGLYVQLSHAADAAEAHGPCLEDEYETDIGTGHEAGLRSGTSVW